LILFLDKDLCCNFFAEDDPLGLLRLFCLDLVPEMESVNAKLVYPPERRPPVEGWQLQFEIFNDIKWVREEIL